MKVLSERFQKDVLHAFKAQKHKGRNSMVVKGKKSL